MKCLAMFGPCFFLASFAEFEVSYKQRVQTAMGHRTTIYLTWPQRY